ncbi:mercury resistance system periplasmic binding protein MerP [Methylotenera sp.]|uniref:mercury resistance system periplasmic binding protein MerP n=1 Tax=Methylotenera sp. TaxID=2051956 RepID=UPI002737058E|nr:mercury resistance system periplasmic binding protein MerP [Methylotenera sp.]MDP3307078.1 mercury resistance system periplasmic binding protein MerP [Methylotenera sp.]
MKILLTLFMLTTLATTPALATMKTVTLSVPGMTCSVCPITVKKALTKVEGVTKTDVNFKKREAAVTFDDTKANIQTLTKATSDAGYPSTLRK